MKKFLCAFIVLASCLLGSQVSYAAGTTINFKCPYTDPFYKPATFYWSMTIDDTGNISKVTSSRFGGDADSIKQDNGTLEGARWQNARYIMADGPNWAINGGDGSGLNIDVPCTALQ